MTPGVIIFFLLSCIAAWGVRVLTEKYNRASEALDD